MAPVITEHDDLSTETQSLFENRAVLTPVGSKDSLPSPLIGPIEFRDSHVSPRFVSSFDGAHRYRDEFLEGARLLGLGTTRKPIHPQQFVIADALNACTADGIPLFSTMGVCIPRRATKTTSVFAVLLGRCALREDYQVGYSAQSGLKGRDRFLKDVVHPLERLYPNKATRPFKISLAKGSERIEWPSGSAFIVLPPQGESYRGDAFDAVFLDEAQEHGVEDSTELIGSITPVFITRPEAQIIIAGTAGEHQSAMLWDTLEHGRNGTPNYGIVEYAADPETPVYDPEIHETVEGTTDDPEVWKLSSPAIGTVAALDAIADARTKMTAEAFAREFLGIWPSSSTVGFINAAKFAALGNDGSLPSAPKSFALAFAVHPAGSYASIVAAWRIEGVAQILVLEHGEKTAWLYKQVLAYSRHFKTPIIHETMGAALVEVEQLERARPKPKLLKQSWANVSTGAALIMKEITSGNLQHWNQDPLTDAISVATKRGTPRSDKWAFNALTADGDITALNAAAMALRAYDDIKPRAPMRLITAA
jgi:hypothetical protein